MKTQKDLVSQKVLYIHYTIALCRAHRKMAFLRISWLSVPKGVTFGQWNVGSGHSQLLVLRDFPHDLLDLTLLREP